MRSLWLTILFLGSISLASAQEDRERYYSPYEHDEPYRPMIESDSSLFYHAIQLPYDLYGEITRYTFNHIATARYGERFSEQAWYLGESSLTYRNYALLRASGLEEEPSNHLTPFTVPEPSFHRIQLHVTGHRYLAGIRYRMHLSHPHSWQSDLYAEGRLGQDLYTYGVYTHSLRFAFRSEKQWNERCQLSFMAAIAPTEEGRASNTTQEAYNLTGSNYYNPSWGFYQGEVRSARIRRELLPMAAVTLKSRIGSESELNFIALVEGGTRRQGALGWFDAITPLPDNYRKLPSYFEQEKIANEVAKHWQANESRYTQIDWEELCAENRLSDQGAHYVEQERVERLTRLQLCIGGRSHIGSSLQLDYAIWGRMEQTRNYLQLKDLLEAAYLLDIDYYLIDDDTYSNSFENDLRHPQRKIYEGDRFGYDYALKIGRLGARASLLWHHDRWSLDLHLGIEEAQIHRKGFYEKELFAGTASLGPSKKILLSPYHCSLRAGYAFTPRHLLGIHLFSEGRLPEAENLFLQTQYNNRTILDPCLEEHYGADLIWRSSGAKITWSATLFTRWRQNGIRVEHLYDDIAALYTDRVTTRIASRYIGLEAAATWYLSSHWRLHLAASAMEARYTQNPLVTLYSDRDNTLLCDHSESLLKGSHPGNTPQLYALVGLHYFGKQWGIRMEGSWVGGRYAQPDFMRRTTRISMEVGDTARFDALRAQEHLKDLLRVDLSLWKNFRLSHSSRLTLSLSIDNLLNDDRAPYAAYEQGRIRRLRSGTEYLYQPMENRLSYAAPRTLYLSATLRF